jgi:hypothetical protein
VAQWRFEQQPHARLVVRQLVIGPPSRRGTAYAVELEQDGVRVGRGAKRFEPGRRDRGALARRKETGRMEVDRALYTPLGENSDPVRDE